jgi:hypothetical protein
VGIHCAPTAPAVVPPNPVRISTTLLSISVTSLSTADGSGQLSAAADAVTNSDIVTSF